MLTCPGAAGVPTDAAGAWLIHRTTKVKDFFWSRSLIRTCFLAISWEWLSGTQAGSVIEVGAVAPLAP